MQEDIFKNVFFFFHAMKIIGSNHNLDPIWLSLDGQNNSYYSE